MNNTSPVYSIIIPHKNIPHLLQRCLDSIPRRKDVQIIVVDDNSEPDKVDFAHFPGLNDPYVEIVFGKNENGRKGAGYARNLGLERARGKWLIFADADDFFMPCFNEILDKYADDENDLIYFKSTSVESKTLEPHDRHERVNTVLSEIQKTNDWSIAIILPSVVWGRFFRHSIIFQNNILFQEVEYSNDVLFSAKLVSVDAKRIIYNEIMYCTTNRTVSLMGTHTIEAYLIRFQVTLDVCVYLKELKEREKLYILDSAIVWWSFILSENARKALSLIPKMVKVFGLRNTFNYINWRNTISHFLHIT